MRYVITPDTYNILNRAHQIELTLWLAEHGVDLREVVWVVIDPANEVIVAECFVHDYRGRARGQDEYATHNVSCKLRSPFPPALHRHCLMIWVAYKPPRSHDRRLIRHPYRNPHSEAHRPKEIYFVMSNITVRDDVAPFHAHLQLLDAAGQPTTPDDVPVWGSSADNVAQVTEVSVDGLSATILVSAVGSAQITATTIDRDGTKLVLSGHIDVQAGEAVQGDITFDAPADAPPVVVPPAEAPPGDVVPGDVTPPPDGGEPAPV